MSPVSVRKPSAADVAAMRRALGTNSDPKDPTWLKAALAPAPWLIGAFVDIVLESGGRCQVRTMSDQYAEAMVHGAPWLRWRVPFDGWAYLDPELVNRFFTERGGVT